jgi:HD superfamily phosphohydrolase YqeK
MGLSKKLLDKVYDEMIEELKIDEQENGIKTFAEIEEIVHDFGKEFQRRMMEKAIKEQRKRSDKKKRHVIDAGQRSRT